MGKHQIQKLRWLEVREKQCPKSQKALVLTNLLIEFVYVLNLNHI